MLSCGALERNNNPYIEEIVEPCDFKNQEEIFTKWTWLRKKSWKSVGKMKKITHELKVEFVHLCEKEQKY